MYILHGYPAMSILEDVLIKVSKLPNKCYVNEITIRIQQNKKMGT